METVGRQCASELGTCSPHVATFERCIVANKGDGRKCAESQMALSQCAARAVPMLQTIKEQCSSVIRAYDLCLAHHSHKSDDEVARECTPALRSLWECTERVKAQAQAEA